MAEIPRRWRFQIHLSTAVVLMFVAGGLIWANLTPEKWWDDFAEEHSLYLHENFNLADFPLSEQQISPKIEIVYFGWPLVAMQKTAEFHSIEPATPQVSYAYRGYWEVVIDCVIAVAILFAVWFICEWISCRNKSKGT